eukprot:jgi/Mesvir1/26563/Mv16218-RA.1
MYPVENAPVSNVGGFYGSVLSRPQRPGDYELACAMFPVYTELMREDNIARIRENVKLSFDIDVTAEQTASMVSYVYGLREDASYMERVLVERGNRDGIWEVVSSINKETAKRIGQQNSVYSTRPAYEQYARVFLGDEQPDNSVIPHLRYTSVNRRACTESIDGSNILFA